MNNSDINISPLIQKTGSPMYEDDLSESNAGMLYDTVKAEMEGEKEGSLFFNTLAANIQEKFGRAKDDRGEHEDRWLKAFRNYRGVYGKHVKFRENEKSRVFIKITKTKVLAAYGQLIEIVSGGDKFPLSINYTRVPEDISEHVHFQAAESDIEGMGEEAPTPTPTPEYEEGIGWAGDGKELPAGARHGTFNLGPLQEIQDEGEQGSGKLVEGISPDPNSPTVNPAKIAARNMEKLIHDQIEESNGHIELRSAMFEACLFGSGVIKGPFNYNKTLHKWEMGEDGERTYTPQTVRVPRIEFVSIWDFYPDPEARNINEAEWIIQRHKLNRSELRALKNRPFFDKEEIGAAISDGPNYINEDFELSIRSDDSSDTTTMDRWEVLEYWGVMDKDSLEGTGIDTEDFDDMEEIQVNVWVCGGHILRAVANPFIPARIPYLIFPYERNPYSIFGVGVAENMEDHQMIMNGSARMGIDNLALAGNLVFDIDENALSPGENMEIYPGKVFKRVSGVPGQAIYGIKFPSTATEHMQMFDKFRQLADEATGMPSYSHGQTGVSGMTRTASGMSMLMGAASQNIKTVVINLDDFLLKPLGDAFFQWNMRFYEGKLDIVGDLEVRANGVHSLMQKEVRSQRLMTLMQVTQNQALIPFIKIPTLIKEVAYSMDIDPDELINDADMLQVMAMLSGKMQQQGPAQAPAGANPNDPTGAGGGNIGVGQAPMPGEQGNSEAPPQMPPEIAAAMQGGQG